MNTLILLLQIAGIGHFGILIASVQVPAILDWKHELAKLNPFMNRLFWVYGVFIALTIIGFGTVTLTQARELAAGGTLARSVAMLIAGFWAARLGVQCFVFDARAYLTNVWRKLGYHTLTAAFVFFTAVYGWAAFH